MLIRFIKRCVQATLTRDVKSMNHKIDKVSADATALTSHEETEWCLDACHIVLQLLLLYKMTHICPCAYDGIWGIGGVASHIFHLSTSVLVLAYRHLGQQFWNHMTLPYA